MILLFFWRLCWCCLFPRDPDDDDVARVHFAENNGAVKLILLIMVVLGFSIGLSIERVLRTPPLSALDCGDASIYKLL